MKVRKFEGKEHYMIFCPGCKHGHVYTCGKTDQPRWTFDGNMLEPTFEKSMLVNPEGEKGTPHCGVKRCHSIVTDGNIRFLNDCDHDLAGQTVPLEDF